MSNRNELSSADPKAAMRQAFVAAVKAERAVVEWLRASDFPEWEMVDRMRCRPTGLNGEGGALQQDRCTALAARGNPSGLAVWVFGGDGPEGMRDKSLIGSAIKEQAYLRRVRPVQECKKKSLQINLAILAGLDNVAEVLS